MFTSLVHFCQENEDGVFVSVRSAVVPREYIPGYRVPQVMIMFPYLDVEGEEVIDLKENDLTESKPMTTTIKALKQENEQ